MRRSAMRYGPNRHWFGYQHSGIRPDVVTLAKRLAGGVPVGACITLRALLPVCSNRGITVRLFGGNQLTTTAALTTIEVVERDKLIDNAVTAA